MQISTLTTQPSVKGLSQKPRLQIPSLTGLRFFAAFFILLAHAADWIGQFQNATPGRSFDVFALYGMPLFFVLSGFVIHYNYRELFSSKPFSRAFLEFAAARIARLFPLYFFLLVVAIFADNFIASMYQTPQLIPQILLHYITLTQSWFYVILDGKIIINLLFPLSWSISTELFFYLAYLPVVFFLLKLRRPIAALSVCALYTFFVLLALISSKYHLDFILSLVKQHLASYIAAETDFANSFYRWLFYFSPYVRVFEFFMGCLAAHAFILLGNRPVTARENRLGIAVLTAAICTLIASGLLYKRAITIPPVNMLVSHLALNFLCGPAIAAIIFCVSRYKTAFARVMAAPVLVALGDTSYSIYLVHTWTLRLFNRSAPPLTVDWGIECFFRVLVAIVFTLIVAYGTYHVIEVPARAWLRRHFTKWTASLFSDGGQRTRPPTPLVQAKPADKNPLGSNGQIPGEIATNLSD